MQTAANVLAERLGLSDDELLTVLDVGALELVGGELDHKPELALLLALSEDRAATMTPGSLQRWVRTSGAHGRPIDLLLARDFAAFERALDDLGERGFVVRRS
jgi:hypothetical protein